MSHSSKPRVVRKHKPGRIYRLHNYREAFPLLMEDFEQRCAYSMVHVKGIAESQMHVDHHDPRLKRASPYENLFPACAICNMAKSDRPNDEERRNGLRLMNPCSETEYGNEIFEDPQTHELVGTTDIASYHIDILDLNNPALVYQRSERSQLLDLMRRPVFLNQQRSVSDPSAGAIVQAFIGLIAYKIPEIPPPPGGLAKQG